MQAESVREAAAKHRRTDRHAEHEIALHEADGVRKEDEDPPCARCGERPAAALSRFCEPCEREPARLSRQEVLDSAGSPVVP